MEWSEERWTNIGQQVRKFRKLKHWSQPQLATAAGVSHPNRISEIELGKRAGTILETIADIAWALDVQVSDLLVDIEPPGAMRILRIPMLASIPCGKPSMIFDQAGLENIHLHCLRHSYSTLLLKAEVNPLIVSGQLGHASVRTTLDTYSHVLPTIRTEAIKRLEGFAPKALPDGSQKIG